MTAIHAQVSFHCSDERYRVQETPFSLEGNVTETELNDLINQLLSSDIDNYENKQFLFLVGGEFLGTSLFDHAQLKNISLESVIKIEYLLKENPPKLDLSLNHNDWVSDIRCNRSLILTGSYDCSVTIWDSKNGKQLSTGIAHVEPVKSVNWVKMSNKDSVQYAISSSQDQNLILWEYIEGKEKIKPLFRLKGHSKSVECSAVSHDCSKIASGSWDCSLKLWSASNQGDGQHDNVLTKKKRQKVEKSGLVRVPQMTLSGHNEVVSDLVWMSDQVLCSSSWDHSIKLWDMEQGKMQSNLQGNKAILSMDYSQLSKTLVTGCTDRHIRLWDPRSSDSVVKSNLTSHHGWVTSVCWSPTQSHLLVSGSFDNVVKMWDIRSSQTPLFDIDAHKDKVLCVDWSEPGAIASGGADNKAFSFSAADGSIINEMS